MVKRLLLLGLVAFALSAQAQYQLTNSNFEKWESVTSSATNSEGQEPISWSSFLDGTGILASAASYNQLYKSTETRPGSTGSYSARLTSRAVTLGLLTLAVAQGNLTNGCINMGSRTATDGAGNYNYLNASEDDEGELVRPDQYMSFKGKPDAISVWVKFKGKKNYGNISAYLTTNGYFQDPEGYNEDDVDATKVAYAKNTELLSNDTWTQYIIPFEYTSTKTVRRALVSFSTCATPGGGDASDYMYVDDVEMIYYSELDETKSKYDGNLITFDENHANNTDFKSVVFDESKLSLVSTGKHATVTHVFNRDTGVLTITVKGNNYSEDSQNFHTYTIQFYAPQVASTKDYSENLYVYMKVISSGAENTNGPQEATFTVETMDNGVINFKLNNFILNGDNSGDDMYVGNIAVSNLTVNADNTFTYTGNIKIEAGTTSLPEGKTWMGPTLGDIPLVLSGKIINENLILVSIDINIVVQYVVVHLGYDRAVLSVSDAKYGTFAAPVDITLPSGVTAYKVTSVDNTGVLELTKAAEAGETLTAGTAVVVASESPASAEAYFYTTETSTTTDLLTGVYEATDIKSGYVLQNQSGEVGFYRVDSEITVPANRCYLTARAGVKALVFPDGTQTSISAIQANDEKAVMYDLSGRRVSKATKGIYITNGKKVLVK